MSEQPMSKNKIYSHESLTARGLWRGRATDIIAMLCDPLNPLNTGVGPKGKSASVILYYLPINPAVLSGLELT